MILFYNDRLLRALILFLSITAILLLARIITRKRCKKRFFRFGELIMVGAAVIFAVAGYFGKWVDIDTANTRKYSKQALLNDINQLENVLMKENPLYYADKEALKEDFEATKAKITHEMTEEEFYRLVNPLVVKVQCGHTNLSISKALQENRKGRAKFLPLNIKVEENELIDRENGEIIVSINGKPSNEVIEELLKNVSHDGDNLAGAYYILNISFATKYYDFIEQPEQFQIVYQKEDGTMETKQVKAQVNDKDNLNSWEVRMAQYNNVEYYTSEFSKDTATLKINVFMKGNQSFPKFLKEFFARVKEEHIPKVIIDVRGNFGGDPGMAKELLSYLITKPFDYFKNGLTLLQKIMGYGKKVQPKYDQIPFQSELLIDGACFSTCGHFAAIYQSLGLGVVKGSQTGGGYLCTDGSKDIVLYQTGLRLHYSTQIFEVNADCEKPNVVCPDGGSLLQ